MFMEQTLSQPKVNPMKQVLAIRDFMLLWIGQATSMLGDQFYSIAGAWLVLKMTGDPLALGLVLALGGIPRAIFTVIGGAITDRISPRQIMLITDVVRLLLSALMAVQVFTGTLQIWMIYGYAVVFGIMGGFFGPASMSIVPHIVPGEQLQAGNSLSQGSSSLIGFIGPALAGGVIALFPNEKLGVAIAIAFDALTFLVSIATLWSMHRVEAAAASTGKIAFAEVFLSIREGFAYMVKDPVLRLMFIIIAIANLCFGGPVIVGIPYLADTRFAGGAAAYGIIISGYAGGNLLGIILSGVLPKLKSKFVKGLMVIMFTAFGVGLIALGWISLTWLATADLFVLGILNGYLAILLITALQRSTPREMLGRLMSMVLLANMSVMPLSQAIAGAALRWNVVALFVIAGGLLLLLTGYLAFSSSTARMSVQLVGDDA
jgi:MFS family permease